MSSYPKPMSFLYMMYTGKAMFGCVFHPHAETFSPVLPDHARYMNGGITITVRIMRYINLLKFFPYLNSFIGFGQTYFAHALLVRLEQIVIFFCSIARTRRNNDSETIYIEYSTTISYTLIVHSSPSDFLIDKNNPSPPIVLLGQFVPNVLSINCCTLGDIDSS